MEVTEQTLILFRFADGRSPYEDWVSSLTDVRTKEMVYQRISRLRSGNFGDTKSVGEGVWELRIHYGPGFRVYFGKVGRTLVILLCGGDKSSQARDIWLARKLWRLCREKK